MNTENPACAKIAEAIAAFPIETAQNGSLAECSPYGNGHINDTFLLRCKAQGNHEQKFILQRMNHEIFQNPPKLMENIVHVTQYLHKIILSEGGDPNRETLNVLQTRDGADFFVDSSQNYWRVFPFIERSVCLEKVESAKDFYDSAVTFGRFQKQLADFPVAILHETIPNFHNTASRFADFQKAVLEGDKTRAALAQAEITFALDRKDETCVLTSLLAEGALPLRVTHNDTKLNNILFDADTRKALCIIDLDTVMPGLSLYDFGDSIRFGASTGAEDETDLTKVELNLTLFEAFTRGYLEGCAGSLSAKEIELLPMGAKLMTYECGIRFLADFLTGDHYFKIHREHHNLDRARTQFRLVADMEAKWDKMAAIVESSREALSSPARRAPHALP